MRASPRRTCGLAMALLLFSAAGAAADHLEVGAKIMTRGDTAARVSASSSATQLGSGHVGVVGTIVDGPMASGGNTWWKVDYQGPLIGWSPQSQIEPAYFPPSESAGGWRSLVSLNATPTATQKTNVRNKAELDWDKLKLANDYSHSFDSQATLLVIRNGWVAGEWGSRSAIRVASISKSITGLTLAKLWDLSATGQLAKSIGPDDPAHLFLPADWLTNDPRKQAIKIRDLMTMTSGLQPDDQPSQPNYLDALLNLPVRAAPGVDWSYASSPVDLLGLVIEDVGGGTVRTVFNQQIAPRLGIPAVSWTTFDGHNHAASGASMSARDLARIGHLMLMDGMWSNGTDQQAVVSSANIAFLRSGPPCVQTAAFSATPGSPFDVDTNAQDFYGHLWWTNLQGLGLGSVVPSDAFYAHGLREKLLIVVPTYNLIVVRLGTAPESLQRFRRQLMELIMAAVTRSPVQVSAQLVGSATLINADTDRAVRLCDPIPPNALVQFGPLGTTNLNIRANTGAGTVGSVRFSLDATANFRTETSPPYALAGDNSGNFAPWTPTAGAHKLVVTPFTQAGGTGIAGLPLSTTFTVEP